MNRDIFIRNLTNDKIEMSPKGRCANELTLIVFYEDRKFVVPYQKEYVGELLRMNRNSHYAFVFAHNDEYNYFWNHFGKNFQK